VPRLFLGPAELVAALGTGDLEEANEHITALLEAAGIHVEDEGHDDDEGDTSDTDMGEVSPALVPLQEALEAIEHGDLETAEHELLEFVESAEGMDLTQAEEALTHLLAGELHDVEDILGEMLGTGGHS
jgi:hypothetical protein